MRTPLYSIVLALALAACGDGKTVDADGDGVAPPLDCDDSDPDIVPGADETACDGIDNNCDTLVDEGLTVQYWPDADADGAGDANAAMVEGCVMPAAAVANDDDCDDQRADVNPAAAEDCDPTVDRNCDGDPVGYATDAGVWYRDDDLDGYGDPATATTGSGCEPEPGFVIDDTDCDDQSDLTYPGAPELCDDGADNDCDPLTDDDDSPTAPTFYVDDDGDGHGDPAQLTQACEVPPGASELGDDCDDQAATTYPGANDLCDGGVDNDCDPATNEAFDSMWYRDTDGDGYGNDSVTYVGCSPPPDYIQVAGDCDDSDPALNPDLTPGCVQFHCGTLALSTTWSSSVVHQVTCDVDVEGAARPLLTIEDGAVVLFAAGTELAVGEGNLGEIDVQGDTLGVTFTSAELFPAEGDWDGLWIGESDQGSTITGLTVEFAGGNGFGGIKVEGGSPVIERLISRNNLGSGLFIDASEPLVFDSTFVENTDAGVYVDVGAGLSRVDALGAFGPSFTNNLINDNRGQPIVLPGSHADEVDLSNVLSPNDEESIGLLAGTLRFTGTWYDHGLPYVVVDNATIDVEDGPQAQLFIEDGVEVLFGSNADLVIGDGVEGRLEIIDGPIGVTLGATLEVILASDNWDGLKFGPDDNGSVVRNLTVEYGGGNVKGNIWVSSSAPLIESVLSRYSDSNGIYVGGTLAAPEIRNSTIVDNDENGVYVEASSGIARSLLAPTFANNLLTGNGLASVVLPPNFVGELDPSTTFSGNGLRVQVHGGDVLEEATWRKLDEDYQALGNIDIGGPQDPVVTIEPEVAVWFDRDTALTAGEDDDGALSISADPGFEVRFTSSDPAPGEGDWYGLRVGKNGQISPQTNIRGLLIEYAGGSDAFGEGGALELIDIDTCSDGYEPPQTFSYVHISDSSKSCFYVEKYTQFYADYFTCNGSLEPCWNVEDEPPGCPNSVPLSFTNNDCQDGVFTAYWPGEYSYWFDSVYNNTTPGPMVVWDTDLTVSTTIPAISTFWQYTGLVSVQGLGAPVLTVASGAVVGFEPGAGLEIGMTDPGGLVVQSGAVLGSYAGGFAAPGSWEGVTLGPDCTTVNLQNATIEYGGANTFGNLYVDGCDNASALISNMSFDSSSSCGLYLDATDTPLTLESGSTYAGNLAGDRCP